ncbi:hypothetical protein HPB51_016144 [Rhipicephalus microplus]|uniref:TGS domain-containing protein n=1 Tax=Rhipicephalus microplus TaxID=6941 RepID=A0A9J6DAA7_RHIMP|nr:hypothetical protein HPB51_016144 [Rhipicephalus microplus]
MKVNLAFHLFSLEVLRGLFFYKRQIVKQCSYSDQTEKFVDFMHKLIDVMTSRVPSGALKPNSKEAQLLNDTLEYINKWEACTEPSKGGFLSPGTAEGLRVSLKATLELLEYLAKQVGFKYLLTSRLSQDPLEKLFGVIRQFSGCNDHPTSAQFLTTVNCLAFYNLVKPPDSVNTAGGTLVSLVGPNEVASNVDNLIDAGKLEDASSVLDASSEVTDHIYPQQTSDARLVYYLAGYVASRKVLTTMCQDCFQLLLTSAEQADKVCSSSVAPNELRLTNEALRKKRDALFTAEKERQAALITRVDKIEVQYLGPMEDCTLIMNKGISTPHDCARHIHESLVQRAAIAEVDGEPWDMSRPLLQDCQLRLNFYKDPNPYFANKVWVSSSSYHSMVIASDLANYFYILYKARDEMDVLSGIGRRLATKPHHFERLDVDASVALRMFEDNKYKAEQIPRIAAASPTGNTVTLYRLLDHVDISSGPMIGSLDHMSRFKIVAVYPMDTSIGLLYRFQGLAIPSSFSISEFAYNVCCERAQRMNYTGLPKTEFEADEEPSEDNVHFEDVSAEDEHVESKITSDNVAAAPKDSAPAAPNRASSS